MFGAIITTRLCNLKLMYDIAILGGGPAGYTASVYASRSELSNIIITETVGGQMAVSVSIENYPGFEQIPGPELAQKFKEHAESYGVETVMARVTNIEQIEGGFRVTTNLDETYEAKTVIYALGANHRHLGVPGEEEFNGKGVAYCATCDGFFFKNKVVAVVGGGDSATTAALYLADLASQVYLIHRRDTFRSEPIWVTKVKEHENIELILNNSVKEITGSQLVEKLILSEDHNGSNELPVNGIFVEIGQVANIELAQELGVEISDKKLVKINPDFSTNIEGFYAVGEVADSNPFRQVITAAAEAATAADSIKKYLS